MKFEYQILTIYYSGEETSKDIEYHLNDEGKNDWEVIFIESMSNYRNVWMKRELVK